MAKLTQEQVAHLFDCCVPKAYEELANTILRVNWFEADAWCDLDTNTWELEIHLNYEHRGLADEIGKVFTQSATEDAQYVPFMRVSFVLHNFRSFVGKNTD